MDANAPAAGSRHEREWWLRALAVLQAPRAVFAALGDDSDDAAGARQEPVLALVFLAGIAGVLLTGARGRFLDDPAIDSVLVAVLIFLTGGIYGAASYWLGGGALHLGVRAAGGRGSYRRARHVLAFAAAPLVLTLVLVWPVRLALYGTDSFRSGGADEGAGGWILDGAAAAFALWSFALLVYGISVVERWTVVRAAVALALVLLGLLVLSFPLVIPLSSR
ncbi:MAG TPA: Yip1 family protein [Gaiellaceae bacterium]|nr:Yip1 family protein [Gaiellaceae bacterium]